MSIKGLISDIKHNGLLTSMAQLEKLYRIAIENEEKLAESEAKCAALAAENAGLKESRKNLAEFIHEKLDADYPLNMNVETQAIDAFLAEVRAQGVDSAVETITVHMNPRHLAVAEVLRVLRTHAEQLRKEVK